MLCQLQVNLLGKSVASLSTVRLVKSYVILHNNARNIVVYFRYCNLVLLYMSITISNSKCNSSLFSKCLYRYIL